MKISEDTKLDFKDVLIVPKRSKAVSRSEVNVLRTFKRKNGVTFTAIPIISANMTTVSTFDMARVLTKIGCMCALHKHYTVDEYVNFFNNASMEEITRTFFTIGIKEDELIKLDSIMEKTSKRITNICIDVANGYTDVFVDTVKKVVDKYPDCFYMAGNVVTPNMVEELIMNGVDVIKVGIGGGSACKTRMVAGVGYPQLSCIMECADAAHGLNRYLCSDGGCSIIGDVSKAFCGNADIVMLGGMLAGHKECNSNVITRKFTTTELNDLGQPIIEHKLFCEFYGMSSEQAMKNHNGGKATYKASEGRLTLIPYKGDVEDTINEILGGIRSTCTYIGTNNIKNMGKCGSFVRSTIQENKVFEKFTV